MGIIEDAIARGMLQERETPMTDLEKAHQMMSAEKPITAQLKDIANMILPKSNTDWKKISEVFESGSDPEGVLFDIIPDTAGMTKAFHGTPKRAIYSKFDTQHIGSGEGGAARGWGFYFTDVRDIASDTYARMYFGKGNTNYDTAIRIMQATDHNVDDALKEVARRRTISNMPGSKEKWDKIEGMIKNNDFYGRVYKATLHPNKEVENWLDWDELINNKHKDEVLDELKKESKSLANALNNDFLEYKDKGIEITGGTLYKRLSDLLGGKHKASEFLDRAGIDGIRFEAGSITGIKPQVIRNKLTNLPESKKREIWQDLKVKPGNSNPTGFNLDNDLLANRDEAYNIAVKKGIFPKDYNYVIFNPEHIQVDEIQDVSGKVIKSFVQD